MLRGLKAKILFSLLSILTAAGVSGCHASSSSSAAAAPGTTTAPISGQVNSTFGSSGYATTLLGALGSASGVATQSTGSIIILYQNTTLTENYYLARFTASGILDTSFGFAGQMKFQCSFHCAGSQVVIQSDDSILVVNSTNYLSSTFFSVNRFTPNGALDTTYGNSGATITTTGIATAAFIDPSTDNLVIAGTVPSPASAFVERFLPTGALDTTFNGTGILTFSSIPGIPGTAAISASIYNSLTLEYLTAANVGTTYLLGQLTTSASIDTTFGTSGVDNVAGGGVITALAVQPNGEILLGTSSGTNIQISRLLTNGQLDTAFGTSGSITFATGDTGTGTVTNLFVDLAGNILAVYNGQSIIAPAVTAESVATVFRVTTAGVLDSSFGSAGSLSLPGFAVNSSILLGSGPLVLAVTGASGAQLTEIQ